MATIMYGKPVAKKIIGGLAGSISNLKARGITPKLDVIMVGSNGGSGVYTRSIERVLNPMGVEVVVHNFDNTADERGIEALIERLNQDSRTNGILMPFPLPPTMSRYMLVDLINPLKDVEGLNHLNVAALYRGQKCFEPCTPKAILKLLGYYKIGINGNHVVVVGRSEIVGNPLYLMLDAVGATVTQCHSGTKNLERHIGDADILVVAVGKPGFVKADTVKEDAVIVDVGTNVIADNNGKKVVGDVDFNGFHEKRGYITPVPMGVGPVTIACLMENVINACEMQNVLSTRRAKDSVW